MRALDLVIMNKNIQYVLISKDGLQLTVEKSMMDILRFISMGFSFKVYKGDKIETPGGTFTIIRQEVINLGLTADDLALLEDNQR